MPLLSLPLGGQAWHPRWGCFSQCLNFRVELKLWLRDYPWAQPMHQFWMGGGKTLGLGAAQLISRCLFLTAKMHSMRVPMELILSQYPAEAWCLALHISLSCSLASLIHSSPTAQANRGNNKKTKVINLVNMPPFWQSHRKWQLRYRHQEQMRL